MDPEEARDQFLLNYTEAIRTHVTQSDAKLKWIRWGFHLLLGAFLVLTLGLSWQLIR
jgi:hypothetical protein